MVSSLLKLLHDPTEAVTHIAVAFDDPIESFRNELFAGYKTSEGLPDSVLQQFAIAQAGVRALGVTVWPQAEFEADDAIATAALWGQASFDQIRICSPDKDFAQLVNDQIVQVDRARGTEFDADMVRERLGVEPADVPLFLAIAGDTADGIPGVPGFGATSTATLVNRYPTLDAIPDDCAAWDVALRGKDRLCTAFNAHRADVALFLTLTTLCTDVPLPLTRDGVAFAGVPRASFITWCDDVAAETLKARPSRWAAS